MRFAKRLPLLLILLAHLLAACAHPISVTEREQADAGTTLAVINENPGAYLDHHLVLGGVVIGTEETEDGGLMEIMEWHLNRWGEPAYPDDAGHHFLVKTADLVDPAIYEPGMLVTLAVVARGEGTRQSADQLYSYPLFDLAEIYLWESPFRYGIHNHSYPARPDYVDKSDTTHRNPYNPGYARYPFTQDRYRNMSD